MQKAAPPKSADRKLITGGGDSCPAYGASWIDVTGRGQGTWLARRGRYYIQVRATFTDPQATQAAVAEIYDAAAKAIPETKPPRPEAARNPLHSSPYDVCALSADEAAAARCRPQIGRRARPEIPTLKNTHERC